MPIIALLARLQSSWCSAILFISALSLAAAMTARAADSFQYVPLSLPQEADPAWQNLGNIRGEIGTDALVAHTSLASWSQWRLGLGSGDAPREFGDSTSLQSLEGDAITVDFRARIAPDSPNLPVLDVGLANGKAGLTVTFSPGQISISGARQPIFPDTTQWSDYRLVLEGTKGEFFCVQSATSVKVDLVPADWGTYIHFGFPALNELDAVADRSFEFQVIRWHPGQALRDFPDSLAK